MEECFLSGGPQSLVPLPPPLLSSQYRGLDGPSRVTTLSVKTTATVRCSVLSDPFLLRLYDPWEGGVSVVSTMFYFIIAMSTSLTPVTLGS